MSNRDEMSRNMQEPTPESEPHISNSKEVIRGIVNTVLLLAGLGLLAYLLLALLR